MLIVDLFQNNEPLIVNGVKVLGINRGIMFSQRMSETTLVLKKTYIYVLKCYLSACSYKILLKHFVVQKRTWLLLCRPIPVSYIYSTQAERC